MCTRIRTLVSNPAKILADSDPQHCDLSCRLAVQGGGTEREGSADPGRAAAHGGGQSRLRRRHCPQESRHRSEEQGAHR